MKIRVRLTSKELSSIIVRHLNLPSGFSIDDVEIEINESAVGSTGKWNELKKWHDIYRFNPNRKIEAIKAVREAYPGTGLADAKYVLEADWNIVLNYVTVHDTLFNFYRR